MHKTGLVSISFREHSPEEIIQAAAAAGLQYIEWGSDIHAPCDDEDRLQEIVTLMAQYGVSCCAYGTYFRIGVTPVEELPGYIRGAKLLGTNIIRLWAGEKSPWEFTEAERQYFLSQCREIAAMAEKAGVIMCLECHRNTYTETKECALEIMESVNSPAFRMYWQPHQMRTVEENIQYARALKDYTLHIHTFQWKGTGKFPLAEGIDEWKAYLKEFTGEHYLLLEFMPDHRIETLPRETEALNQIVGG